MNMIAPAGLGSHTRADLGLHDHLTRATHQPAAPVPDQQTEGGTAELVAAWPVAPGALLLLGHATTAIAATGTIQLERRRADRGPFRAVTWAGGLRFAAAMRLPPATEPRPGQTLLLQQQEGESAQARLPAEMATPLGFAAAAAKLLDGAEHTDRVALVRFLSNSFPPAALRRLPEAGAMLAALLEALAHKDGCIELMGAIPGACGFLQGWGAPLRTAPGESGVEAFLVGTHVSRCQVRLASFARPDIMAPASGVVLVLPDEAAANLADLERVYLLGQSGVLKRDLVERRLLGTAESSGHIRDMLPSLRCAPAIADSLRAALRPRYEGHETLGAQKLPVRAAVDLALVVPDAGKLAGVAYLTGWLFDPAECVAEVHLRGSAGLAVRLDPTWTRVPRQDVSDALAAHGGFPVATRHDHGFAVHAEAPGLASAGALYLDIGFRDGTCAFLPVKALPGEQPAVRSRALEMTDLHKSSGITIVERHLGPLARLLMRRAPAPVPAEAASPPGWAVAIVVPLVGAPVLPRSFLSQFLGDRLADDEGLAFVCASTWADGDIAALQRLADFMGLRACVVRAPEATGALAALTAASAALPAAAWFLLADPATSGRKPGWRAALRAAASQAPSPTVVCPTLVYEDFSIRFAGAATFAPSPVAPYATVQRALAGMPAALADVGAPRAVPLGTLVCCLLPRAALAAITGGRAGLSTGFGQETAAFLRLQAAGIACRWVPEAQVFAPETPHPVAAGEAVGRLVDGWCLRAAQAAGEFAPRTRTEG